MDIRGWAPLIKGFSAPLLFNDQIKMSTSENFTPKTNYGSCYIEFAYNSITVNFGFLNLEILAEIDQDSID